MRKAFCDAMVSRAAQSSRLVFLTGDLGFMALEPLRDALGERFINAGVAEQNMVSVAAAMCQTGMEAWVYSIAPFCTARPFEQIRNDVALHELPVRIVGNGGGYGYGVMGPTHHAIEDYGTLLALEGMQACIPAFDEDVGDAVKLLADLPRPVYLRLGRGEPPSGYKPTPFHPWRQLMGGDGPVVVGVGPIVGTLLAPLASLPEAQRPSLWVVGMLPLSEYPPPQAFMDQLAKAGALLTIEEHVARGSMASELLMALAVQGLVPRRCGVLHAKSARYERYGSQPWLRRESGLDPQSFLAALHTLQVT
jgi:transketolase